MKILIVEDNEQLRTEIKNFLNETGFNVEAAHNFVSACDRISVYEYDLILIDIGLPDGTGLDLIKMIKEKNYESGILILTAKNKIDDKVAGLNLGADDYMTKPFHKAELNARINSILRRKKFDGKKELLCNGIEIDLTASEVRVNGQQINLTKKEYDLLLYFIYNQNRVLTKESIAEYLWGDHADQSDSFDFIYNHIKNLRKKISSAGGINHIKAMYGMGYKFSVTAGEKE